MSSKDASKGPFCDMNKNDKNYRNKSAWDIQYTSDAQRKSLDTSQFSKSELDSKLNYQNKKLASLTALAKKALDMILPMVQNARVRANYQGKGTWYSGKIVRQYGNKTFDINYDNGNKEKKVPSSRIFANGLFLSPKKLSSWLHTLRRIANSDLRYVSNIQTATVACYNRKYKRVNNPSCRDVTYLINRKKRRCKDRWSDAARWEDVPVGYNANINKDFDKDIGTMTDQVNAIINEIDAEIFNNCENPNTLLDASGMESCGINDKLNDMKNAVAPSKLASNRVMRSIKNNNNYPQYSAANKMDVKLNEMYEWTPLDTKLPFNNDFSALSKTEMEKTIQANMAWAPKQYNDCNLNTTHISVDEKGNPNCVTNSYNSANQKCNQAIDMSKIYEYGTDELSSMWSNVENSLPGNVKLPATTILEISNDSCKKWVDMFNIWEEKEAQALSEPCAPERPIASANDKVLIDMAEEWKSSANEHLQQLRDRLITIKKYIATYPPKGGSSNDLLQLKKENVTLTPSTLPASILVKYKQSDVEGAGPIQYLDIMMPNGTPGEEGDTGIQGIQGETGSLGPRGKTGATGLYILPKQ